MNLRDQLETILKPAIDWRAPYAKGMLDMIEGLLLIQPRPGSEAARLAEFRNALCIIRSIDLDELAAAGVIARDDPKAWRIFRSDPSRWFVEADDKSQRKLWAVIERRARPMFAVTEAHRTDGEAAP